MRAKLQVSSVTGFKTDPDGPTTQETVVFNAVTEKPFDAEGNSEDNQFAKWTPSAEFRISITNPALFGTFVQGEKYYVDFTKAEEAPANEESA